MGKTWHPEHFVCTHCQEEIGSRNFFERDGQPYCEKDYHNLFSPRCYYCNGPILDVSVCVGRGRQGRGSRAPSVYFIFTVNLRVGGFREAMSQALHVTAGKWQGRDSNPGLVCSPSSRSPAPPVLDSEFRTLDQINGAKSRMSHSLSLLCDVGEMPSLFEPKFFQL